MSLWLGPEQMTFIEAHCPSCGHYFRESCLRLRAGETVTCPHCQQGWDLRDDSPFDETQRLLTLAREARQQRNAGNVRFSVAPNRWA